MKAYNQWNWKHKPNLVSHYSKIINWETESSPLELFKLLNKFPKRKAYEPSTEGLINNVD